MQLTREVVRSAQPFLGFGNKQAPREVLAAMVSLTPPDDVAARLVWASLSAPATTWRVLWLTETTLTYGEAHHRSLPSWTYDSAPVSDAADIDIVAWVVPLDLVARLRVAGVRSGERAVPLVVHVRREIELADSTVIPIPLSGDFPDPCEDDVCREFVTQLRSALASRGERRAAQLER